MNVSLTPELERLVNEKVASGMYGSASEVVREALRLLNERDRARADRLAELKRNIAIGIEQPTGANWWTVRSSWTRSCARTRRRQTPAGSDEPLSRHSQREERE
jgi:antitoxin ParD1/3/4